MCTLWYYRSLVSVFDIAASSPIMGRPNRTRPVVEELDRVVGEIEKVADLRQNLFSTLFSVYFCLES